MNSTLTSSTYSITRSCGRRCNETKRSRSTSWEMFSNRFCQPDDSRSNSIRIIRVSASYYELAVSRMYYHFLVFLIKGITVCRNHRDVAPSSCKTNSNVVCYIVVWKPSSCSLSFIQSGHHTLCPYSFLLCLDTMYSVRTQCYWVSTQCYCVRTE